MATYSEITEHKSGSSNSVITDTAAVPGVPYERLLKVELTHQQKQQGAQLRDGIDVYGVRVKMTNWH
jgi:hypothetical protein